MREALRLLRARSGERIVLWGQSSTPATARVAKAVGASGSVLSLEPSLGNLRALVQWISRHGLVQIEPCLIEGDLPQPEWPWLASASFEAALLVGLSALAPADQKALLQETRRWLSSRGRIVVTGLALGTAPLKACGKSGGEAHPEGGLSAESMEEMSARSGLVLKRWELRPVSRQFASEAELQSFLQEQNLAGAALKVHRREDGVVLAWQTFFALLATR